MSSINQLYQEQIKALAKAAGARKKLDDYTHELKAYNPLCGDKFTLWLLMEKEVIRDVSFEGFGCLISKASTELLARLIHGKSLKELELLVKQFALVVNHDGDQAPSNSSEMEVFLSARQFPERKKCATLSWDTLKENLLK